MELTKKLPNEITVRLSLTFQDSPEIHTLLAMTPTRERVKIVRLALERFIVESEHPAGDPDVQLQAISKWLVARKELSSTPQEILPSKDICVDLKKNMLVALNEFPSSLVKVEPNLDHPAEMRTRAAKPDNIPIARSEISETFNRWLTS
ncbi:MAG: hypothetical protein K2Y28_13585 [Burkholderiaceae bacterium]|nr:hypothetical protein [Burkholderiaceae bacterium]